MTTLRSCVLLLCVACAVAGCAGREVNTTALPDAPSNDFRLAQAVMAGGDSVAAIGLYEKALQANPDRVEARLGLADAHLAAGDLRHARSVLDPIAGDTRADIRLGRIAMKQRRFADARDCFKRVQHSDPDNLQAQNALAVIDDLQGAHGQAQAAYRALLREHPDNQRIRSNLGLSLALDRQPRKAINVLIELADVQGAPPQVRQNLAMAYALIGRDETARALLATAALSPAAIADNMAFYRAVERP